jgi:hypothetical protein
MLISHAYYDTDNAGDRYIEPIAQNFQAGISGLKQELIE